MANDVNDQAIHPDAVEALKHFIDVWASNDSVAATIGDGLTRDGVLELLVNAGRAGQLADDPEEAERMVAHYGTLLGQQPPFRLECDADGAVHLVLTLGNRRVETWRPIEPPTVDAEVVALIGESLRNIVRSATDAERSGMAALESDRDEPGAKGLTKQATGLIGMIKTKLGTSNVLTERIGAGKSRDELLEMSLAGLPEQAQGVLAAKLNDQPPFSLTCDENGSIHLVLIVSGEHVHTWTPKELGIPAPKSWRRIVYAALGGLFVVSFLSSLIDGTFSGQGLVAGAMPLALFGMFDGFRLLKRSKGHAMAWRAYWAVAVLWILVEIAAGGAMGGTIAGFMIVGRLGYLWMWIKLVYPFTRGRDVLRCPNCGTLTTHRAWLESEKYACSGCGTIATPVETGRRANWQGQVA